jgi:hypothetical protein
MYTYILIIALLPAAAYAQFDQADWASDVNPNLSKNMMADDYKVLDGGKDTAESTKYLESLCPSCKADIENENPKFRNSAAKFAKAANAQGAQLTIERAGKNAFLDTKLGNPKAEPWLEQNASKYGLKYRSGVGYITMNRPLPTTGSGGASALAGLADAMQSLAGLFQTAQIPQSPAPIGSAGVSPSATAFSPDTRASSGTGQSGAGTSTTGGTSAESQIRIIAFSPDARSGTSTESEAERTIRHIAQNGTSTVPLGDELLQAARSPQALPTGAATSPTPINAGPGYDSFSNATFDAPTINGVIDHATKQSAWQRFVQDVLACLTPMQCTAWRP